MNRKKFILVATAGTAALAIPSWYFNYYVPEYDTALASPGLLSSIWDEATMRTIGAAYRQQFSAEDSERKLVNLLAGDASSTTAQLAEALNAQITTDFESNHTVMINGWVLAITEARQCALYSFSKPN